MSLMNLSASIWHRSRIEITAFLPLTIERIAKLWVKYSGINHNHYMVKEPWFFISYFSQNT